MNSFFFHYNLDLLHFFFQFAEIIELTCLIILFLGQIYSQPNHFLYSAVITTPIVKLVNVLPPLKSNKIERDKILDLAPNIFHSKLDIKNTCIMQHALDVKLFPPIYR